MYALKDWPSLFFHLVTDCKSVCFLPKKLVWNLDQSTWWGLERQLSQFTASSFTTYTYPARQHKIAFIWLGRISWITTATLRGRIPCTSHGRWGITSATLRFWGIACTPARRIFISFLRSIWFDFWPRRRLCKLFRIFSPPLCRGFQSWRGLSIRRRFPSPFTLSERRPF